MDDVDRSIISILQDDARNNTNAYISEQVGLAQSTVGKRIKQLEQSGIITGYFPDIDYDRAGFPLRVLFICSTSVAERREAIEQVVELPGVVLVKELMTGDGNLHIEGVGSEHDDITRLATAIDDFGIDINEEILVKEGGYHRPAGVFTS